MILEIGVLMAFIAMLCWGFGDFLIQKSTRRFGDWETLFLITVFGAIVLFPFVYNSIPQMNMQQFFILLGASSILLVAAFLDFEALKRGKLSIVEPLWSLEIPVSITLAFLMMKETINFLQISIIIILILGLVLTSLKSHHFSKRIWLEKGVFLAIMAALAMGTANFFIGWGSRISDPLFMNWFLSIFLAIISGLYIVFTGDIKKLTRHVKANKKFIASMCIFDNAAWIAFAFSMSLAPIGIAVALSESYIIIAVLLGVFINKEYLHSYQKVGLILSVIAAITLAIITK